MTIVKVYKKIHKRHEDQNWLWKKIYQAKMLVCKHSIEPIQDSEYSYYSNKHYGECINCEALCEIKDI